MTPYFERDGVTIYHGRGEDVLPHLALGDIDLVLTDPPYGIAGPTGTINRKRGKGAYTSAFEDTGAYVTGVVVPLVKRLIEAVPCVVLTPGIRHMSAYPQPASFGTFYQPAAVGLQVFGNVDAQPIFYYGKNALGRNMGVPCSYVLTETADTTQHPCAKPIRAWKRLLSNISRSGQTVLDPFMGSGTTLDAARYLGLRAIGIEIEERYCEIAARRLDQMTLFGSAS